jgi:hypothetical protein
LLEPLDPAAQVRDVVRQAQAPAAIFALWLSRAWLLSRRVTAASTSGSTTDDMPRTRAAACRALARATKCEF